MLLTEPVMLTGPSDSDLPMLQALGYDPAAIVQAAQGRADNEAAFSQIVPDDVRRHPTRLLDRVLARELNTPDMVRAWIFAVKAAHPGYPFSKYFRSPER